MADGQRPSLHAGYLDPHLPTFDDGDHVRFRLVLSEHGWCVGVVWSVQEFLGLPGRAGLTWNVWSKAVEDLWAHLRDCSHRQIDGVLAYDALVADSRDVSFSDEVVATGTQLEQARRWAMGLSEESSWASGIALPGRSRTWWRPQLARQRFLVLSHARADATQDKWLCAMGLDDDGPHLLMRTNGQWAEVPASHQNALAPAGHSFVTEDFVRLFDANPSGALSEPVVAAYSPAWSGDIWAGIESDGERASAELMLANDLDDDPVGLFLHTDERFYMRGEGHWLPLPRQTGINLVQSLLFTEPGISAIPIYDEYERTGHAIDAFLILAALPQSDDSQVTQPRLLEDGYPAELRGARLAGDDLLAQGPFVVEQGGNCVLGMNLRRHHDFLWWTDPSGRSHYLDSTWITPWFGPSEEVNLTNFGLSVHGLLRTLRPEDAEWALPRGGTRPASVRHLVELARGEFGASAGAEADGVELEARRQVPDLRQCHAPTGRSLEEEVSLDELEMAVVMGWIGEVEQPVVSQPKAGSAKERSELVPNDGSWLIIDTYTGHTFGAEAVMVPEPPGELFDLLQNDSSQEERTQYAVEHGRRLLMPGSACGTPVDELEEWDEPPWLIDPINGDCSWEPWHLVIVPRPDDAEVQALYRNENYARGHAIQHGLVPVAPFRLHHR